MVRCRYLSVFDAVVTRNPIRTGPRLLTSPAPVINWEEREVIGYRWGPAEGRRSVKVTIDPRDRSRCCIVCRLPGRARDPGRGLALRRRGGTRGGVRRDEEKR
jgi:hypothetical protein